METLTEPASADTLAIKEEINSESPDKTMLLGYLLLGISATLYATRMLKGEAGFCLVNVTATDEHTLLDSLNSMFTINPIIIKS